jgi:signal transduction histidine kinase
MKRFFSWHSEWAYSISITFIYGAIVLRSILLAYNQPNILIPALVLLVAWLGLFLSEPAISRRWHSYFYFYLIIQTAITFVLMLNPEPSDFFATLYSMVGMQIVQRFRPRTATILIAIFTPLTYFTIVRNIGVPAGMALTVIYLAANALLATYAHAASRTLKLQAQNQATLEELQEANRQLEAYSTQMEQLTVARERNRLARELHDSVTQSIFSMTLTTQSALLLLDRDPARVGEQLQRLNELAQGALAEMQTLISELNPQKVTEGGLENALRRHLAERHLPESLSVSLEVIGEGKLLPAEEQGLFRIAQEGLNNIVKHSSASQVNLRLHLAEPMWMEIQDDGQGFDMDQARRGRGVGLSSMRERAAEIGWGLQITSAPGSGTRIRLEKSNAEAQQKGQENKPQYPILNP